MIKLLFSVVFGLMVQILPAGLINQAQAGHCSDPSQHKALPENYHCHGRGQGTESVDCHDHSGGLQAHKHEGSENQNESKNDQNEK